MIGFKDWYDDWVYLYQDKKKKNQKKDIHSMSADN